MSLPFPAAVTARDGELTGHVPSPSRAHRPSLDEVHRAGEVGAVEKSRAARLLCPEDLGQGRAGDRTNGSRPGEYGRSRDPPQRDPYQAMPAEVPGDRVTH